MGLKSSIDIGWMIFGIKAAHVILIACGTFPLLITSHTKEKKYIKFNFIQHFPIKFKIKTI